MTKVVVLLSAFCQGEPDTLVKDTIPLSWPLLRTAFQVVETSL